MLYIALWNIPPYADVNRILPVKKLFIFFLRFFLVKCHNSTQLTE